MSKAHRFTTRTLWSSGKGSTTSYTSYSRDHEVHAEGRPPIPSSADPVFRGSAARWNPELLLVASLSECHLLWYLHLCSDHGIRVSSYVDQAVGTLEQTPEGTRFTEVVLRPEVALDAGSDAKLARALHDRAHEECFLAKSVNFPVRCVPTVSFVS